MSNSPHLIGVYQVTWKHPLKSSISSEIEEFTNWEVASKAIQKKLLRGYQVLGMHFYPKFGELTELD